MRLITILLAIASSTVNANPSLHELGIKYNTDKIYHHGYDRFYTMFFDKNIDSLLEIGIAHKNSLHLWLEYFPKAFIYGIDINVQDSGNRYKIFKADQSEINDLSKVSKQINKKVDIIIDDGSHIPEHQLLSFNYLFNNLLKDGGVYIIEDIECGYWKRGSLYGYSTKYGANNKLNLINIFAPILHLLNKEFINQQEKQLIIKELEKHISHNIPDYISSVTFAQNCIIIKKKTRQEHAFNNRNYLHQGKID